MTILTIEGKQPKWLTKTAYDSWLHAYFAIQKSLIASGELLEVNSVTLNNAPTHIQEAYINAKNQWKDAFIDF